MNNKQLFVRYYRVSLLLAATLSVGAVILGTSIGARRHFEVFGLVLQQLGVGGFVASTISVALAEYYRELRRDTVRSELSEVIGELQEIIESPDRLGDVGSLINMRSAGVVNFYPNRKDTATVRLRRALQQLRDVQDPVTVRLIGDTLRVFFHPGSDFAPIVHELVTTKPNISFRVLILEPLSANAVTRSQAETATPFTGPEDYRNRSALYHDSQLSQQTIATLNDLGNAAHGGAAIELRLYDRADACIAAFVGDELFTSQYLFGDASVQVNTVRIPMLVFHKGADAWEKYSWHFEHVWRSAASPTIDFRAD